MKIALVSPYDWSFPGGVHTHITALAKHLRGQGHTAHILTAASRPVAEEGVRVIGAVAPLAINGSVARPGLPELRQPGLPGLLRAEGYDLLHLHEPLVAPLTLALALIARGLHIPCIGTFHAAASPTAAWMYRQARPLLRPAFAALAECIAVTEVARATITAVFPADYHIIPNGIEVAQFQMVRRVRATDRPTILFLGRLEPRKGATVLLAALPRLRQLTAQMGDPLPRIVIAGAGPEIAACQQLAGNDPDVRFVGAISDAEKPLYLAAADILCAPSLGGESQGIILLEALATGATVVASDIPGYRTMITPEATGVLVPPGDPIALAQGLQRVLHDGVLRARLAEQGRQAVQRYDWARVGQEVEAVYMAALAQRHATTTAARVIQYA
jgi:phosphatidylinositol alpha-mannosyltransferase